MHRRRRIVILALVPVAAFGLMSGPAASEGLDPAGPDFDGDGFADLAIGVPTEDESGNGAGVVNVLYGATGGLSRHGDQLWSQDSEGIVDETEGFDAFGRALAWGDFDADGDDDLAIGVPGEGLGARRAGAVHVLRGSPAGLTATNAQFWHQDVAGVLGEAEPDDTFGEALATGDFDGDGFADLAIGVPREGPSGAVAVLFGSVEGLTAAGDQLVAQPGEDEPGDLFGAALAAGDVDGDGYPDLAIGAPFEDLGAITNAGAVTVLRGSSTGLTEVGRTVWSQQTPGVLGTAEPFDSYGHSLAVGDVDGDGFGDLAIGVQHDVVAGVGSSGAAGLLLGSPDGLTAAHDQLWTQDSPGFPGEAEGSEAVEDVELADFDADGYADLAIGLPLEFFDLTSIAGVVAVLYGSSAGLTADRVQEWHQDTPGVKDDVEEYDTFGSALTVGDYDGNEFADLGIGVPGERPPPGNRPGGAVAVLFASSAGVTAAGDQFWSQDSRGIRGRTEDSDGFGASLARR